MNKLKSYEIRQRWLDFWKSKGHEVIDSASLIPQNDPTLLWINAGVAPLKKYFDGREVPSNKRMTNAQKSLRTNDIENVGKTARHHTFFEMLGNFSIGDYFKNEVLEWATEVLFKEEWFGLDKDKIYITYYPDDIDTFNRWQEVGIDKSHLIPCVNNFWEIGEGPCGPDTEMFYDRGIEYDPENIGIKLLEDEIENDRYIEIWNIVFSQFNSKAGVDKKDYKELPSKNIDTGMGLERVACIMQQAKTNYETDLFMPIIEKVSEITNVKYEGQMAFKVIADHIRSVVFALSDGASFSNEGRGYVLRRLIRRATRYAKSLGVNGPVLYSLVSIVVDNMKVFYPYLVDKKEMVEKLIKQEEEKFLLTLVTGEKKLVEYVKNFKGDKLVVSKEVAFLLYDTFGFPIELTIEVANEKGFEVDLEGFKEQLEIQRNKARLARNNNQSMNIQNKDILEFKEAYEFVGYEELDTNSIITGVFKDGIRVDSAKGEVLIAVDKSGFYACSGGQNGDIGVLIKDNKTYSVTDTLKLANGQAGLMVELNDDKICVGEKVTLSVDSSFRADTAKNHSATHLLNQALREVVGKHIYQQGSSVANDVLHFDFNNINPLKDEEILTIEDLVNEKINEGLEVNIKSLPIEEAKKLDVQAVFGEKYGKIVRIVDMDFSKEFCGGTHVVNTKDINNFAILSIESKGSGIFRIEATTDNNIIPSIKKTVSNIEKDIKSTLEKIKSLELKAKENGINIEPVDFALSDIEASYRTIINRRNELAIIKNRCKELDKKVNTLLANKNSLSMDGFLEKAILINDCNVVISKLDANDISSTKELADRLVDKLGKAIVFFALVSDKVVFICKNSIQSLDAGKLVKEAAIITLGNGGGRKDFAQAGGKDITKVDEALEKIRLEIEANI